MYILNRFSVRCVCAASMCILSGDNEKNSCAVLNYIDSLYEKSAFLRFSFRTLFNTAPVLNRFWCFVDLVYGVFGNKSLGFVHSIEEVKVNMY